MILSANARKIGKQILDKKKKSRAKNLAKPSPVVLNPKHNVDQKVLSKGII